MSKNPIQFFGQWLFPCGSELNGRWDFGYRLESIIICQQDYSIHFEFGSHACNLGRPNVLVYLSKLHTNSINQPKSFSIV